MKLTFNEVFKLKKYDNSSHALNTWIAGAEAIAMLTGAVESGVIDALRTVNTAQQIAATTGLEKEIAEDILHALEAHDLVEQNDGTFRMARNLELLTSADAVLPLNEILQSTKIRMLELQNVTEESNNYTTLSSDNVVSMAKGVVTSAISFARNFMGIGMGQLLPEMKERWNAGAHHLESGCGVGNTLFQITTTYPKVTAVGIEIEEETAKEAQRRADLLGVANRVEIRHMDAGELGDEAVFDTAQWSQFFFPTSCRSNALRTLYRAMKPGGYVFMPLLPDVSRTIWEYRIDMLRMAVKSLISEPYLTLVFFNALLQTSPMHQRREKRLASINRLVYGTWGVPVKTSNELRAEMENCGFRIIRAIQVPAMQFLPNRGLLLAQRP